jgi:acyl-CoA synthetase (NDP forming)
VEDARAQHRIAGDTPGATDNDDSIAPHPPPLPRSLDEATAKEFIGKWGISAPRRIICGSHEDVHVARRKIKGETVVKILDPRIAHKTEAGGVHVGIRTAKQMEDALSRIDSIQSRTRKKRYTVEAMAPQGLEVIVGARNDPSWGPVVLLGLGGVAAEALGDVAMRLAPLDVSDALSMIDELQASAVFGEFRGMPPRDTPALANALTTVGEIILGTPGIREIDLNPVRVYAEGDGIMALDALIVI